MSDPELEALASGRLSPVAWHDRHLSYHRDQLERADQLLRNDRRMARNDLVLAGLALALLVLVALSMALTLYDVWLHFGGRWPWQ